jgi:hypothetical protein
MFDDIKDYIKMEDLKSYGLYEIHARNGKYGIWMPDYKGFMISRHKFGHNFTFVEHHWDCEAYATAAPLRFIEQSPFVAEDLIPEKGSVNLQRESEILEYINKFEGALEERTKQGRR